MKEEIESFARSVKYDAMGTGEATRSGGNSFINPSRLGNNDVYVITPDTTMTHSVTLCPVMHGRCALAGVFCVVEVNCVLESYSLSGLNHQACTMPKRFHFRCIDDAIINDKAQLIGFPIR